MTQPIASLSLDLDNKWSYLKTHGDAGWESFPSYLDVVVPRFLAFLAERDLKITVFVVGQDAALEKNDNAIASIAAAGHEIGNHSFHHEPWLHLYSPDEVRADLAAAEEHLLRVTGQRTVGFRGPGYSLSPTVLRVLAERGYEYDASTFPTFLGPIARMYYFFSARLSRDERRQRKLLFGKLSEGFRPLRPYHWNLAEDRILEIPVTTMPVFKTPIHLSYLLYLRRFSRWLPLAYFRLALALCAATGVRPSLLLHPLDFLGCDDDRDLAFFPGMNMPSAVKLELVGRILKMLSARYHVVPMREHARAAAERVGAQGGWDLSRLGEPATPQPESTT